MNIVVLSSSQTLADLDFCKGILRKTAERYPDLHIRTDSGNKDAKELTEFAEILGWNVEVWRSPREWYKLNSEIRNAQMLTGYVLDGETLSVLKSEPRADMLLAFQGFSAADNTANLVKWALSRGFRLHLYKEKWTKKKGNDPIYKGIVHVTNHDKKPFALSPESWVNLPKEEKEAA